MTFWEFAILSVSPTGAYRLSHVLDSEPTQRISAPPIPQTQLHWGQEDVQCCSQHLLCQALFCTLNSSFIYSVYFFPGLGKSLLPAPVPEVSPLGAHRGLFPASCHLTCYSLLSVPRREKASQQQTKTHPCTMCEHYRSQPITTRVLIISSSQFSYRLSAYPFFFFQWNELLFLSFLAPSLSFGWQTSVWEIQPLVSKVSRDTDHCCDLFCQRDLMLPKMQFPHLVVFEIPSLRFTGFVLFCLAEHTWEWLLAISRKQNKHF